MPFLGQIAGELPAIRPTTNTRPRTRPGLTPSKHARHGKALYSVGRALVATYMRLMLDVDVQWHAPLPHGPKILAANHPTTADPFTSLTLLPEPVSGLVTAGAFDVPLLGVCLRATGHVPAIRGSGGATVEAVARQTIGH